MLRTHPVLGIFGISSEVLTTELGNRKSMTSSDSIEQPLIPSSSTNAAPDHASNEQRAEVLSFNGILLKSWHVFRFRGWTLLPLAVLLQAGTYVSLPYLAAYSYNWASPLVCCVTWIGIYLVMTLVRATEMALAVYVVRKHYQGDESTVHWRQTCKSFGRYGRLWQIWGASVINSAALYGLLGFGTLVPVLRACFTMYPWWGPPPPHTPLDVARLILFCLSLVATTTLLGSTLILALPAAFIEGSTSIASNLRSVRLGKGQRQQMFGLLAFSLLFNPPVDFILAIFASNLLCCPSGLGSLPAVLVLFLVLAILGMGPATAYFQIVWVVAYLSARTRENPAFVWPPREEALLV